MAKFERAVPSRRKDSGENTARLTRRQSAVRLCCSETTVRALEVRGDLTPYTDHNGVTRYNAAEVAKVAARRAGPQRDGEIAALAFRMFDEGSSVAAVVIECQRTPAQARTLYAEWGALKDAAGGAPIGKAS